MANIRDVRPDTVGMDLGGKFRTLQFDLNAYAELEKKFGSVQDAMNELAKGRMTDVRYILWAGLIHDEAILDQVTGEPVGYNITPYTVGNWIKDLSMLTQAGNLIAQAMGNALPSITTVPGAKEALEAAGIDVTQLASVVLTEEEKAQQAAEDEKNG